MKKAAFLIAMFILVGSVAFGQIRLTLGASGSLYYSEEEWGDSDGRSIADQFRSGEGVYYGGQIELLGRNLGLGGALNMSFWEPTGGGWDSLGDSVELVDMDVNFYLVYHLFRSTSFIDPFLEIGIGSVVRDFAADSKWDPDPGEPISQQPYYTVGAGLGINLRRLGIFTKVNYNIPTGQPEFNNHKMRWVVTEDTAGDSKYETPGSGGDTKSGTVTESEVRRLEDISVRDYRVTVGFKLIF
ncbi:MAG: hypothetical protein EA426_02005 [Spirochaetaceae bacterium]|nr:MAG: hypothetical protein EA426_02005 [Spirochaetaceae bacterium]